MKKFLFIVIFIFTMISMSVVVNAEVYENWNYSIENNEVTITRYIGNEENVIVPNTINGYIVKKIGARAFNYNTNIKKVTLSENINIIDVYAFESCTNLEEIILPDNLEEIRATAFANCYNLKSITIPDNVSYIGSNVFNKCKQIESIIIPKNVTYIEDHVFWSCENLKNIILHDDIEEIESYAFAYCESLANINLPKNLIDIENDSFTGCINLEEIIIPNKVKYIGEHFIAGCTKIEEIFIPKSVESYAKFLSGSFVKKVEIENGATQIPAEAFDQFHTAEHNIVNVSIPNTVEIIGDSAFAYCDKIENIVIPNSVTTIESFAFSNCVNLKEITIPDNVLKLDSYAFDNCTKLENVKLSNNLTVLEDKTFSDCVNLKEIIIPESIVEIKSAFYKCANLENIYFKGDAPIIYSDTFYNANINLLIYYYENKDGWNGYAWSKYNLVKIDENLINKLVFDYEVISELLKTARITKYNGNSENVTIPEKINGYTITEIGEASFSMKDFISIVIPNTITHIHERAFNVCSNLSTIIIPDSVVYIGNNAFSSCLNLSYVKLSDNIKMINEFTFSNCENLTHIDIPDSVTFIAMYAFEQCKSLTSINIPYYVTYIGDGAFQECEKLEKAIFRGKPPVRFKENVFDGTANNFVINYWADMMAEWQNLSKEWDIYTGEILVPMAPATYPEIPDSPKIYRVNFPTDRWGFDNYSDSDITIDHYNNLFYGNPIATISDKDYQKLYNGSNGHCYGMSLITALFNDNYYSLQRLDINNLFLYDVDKSSINNEINISISDMINYAQIYQYERKISNIENKNANKYEDLYKAVYNYEYNNGSAVIISIFGIDSKNEKNGHTVYALRIGKEDSQICEIIVNDSNNPNMECVILLTKNDKGKFDGWDYEPLAWSSEKENGYITFSNPVDSFYLDIETLGSGTSQEEDILLSIDSKKFIVESENVKDNVSDTIYSELSTLIPINICCGNSSNTNLYWLENNNSIIIDGLNKNTNIILSKYSSGIKLEVPANTIIDMDVSKEINYVILETDVSRNVSISHFMLNENNEINTIMINGISNGNVKSTNNNGTIDFSGLSNVTIEIEIEGVNIVKSLPDINSDTEYELNIIYVGGNIDIEITDKSGKPAVIKILSNVLPDGTINEKYNTVINISSKEAVIYDVVNGDLPKDLTLDTEKGIISGIPIQTGQYKFTIQISNESGILDSKEFTITINNESNKSWSIFDWLKRIIEYIKVLFGNFIAIWQPSINVTDIQYEVSLYKDDLLISSIITSETSYDFTEEIYNNGSGTYHVSVDVADEAVIVKENESFISDKQLIILP